MKHQWMAYAIVALLSIGAGVAIAGLPDRASVDATITPPSSTTSTEPTVAPSSSVPVTSDEVVDSTQATTTSTTSTTEPSTTSTTTTVPTSTTLPLPERGELLVAAVNGARADGAAGRMVDQLEALGYVDVLARTGSTVVDFTVVYFAPGFEAAAARAAADLGLHPDFVAPLADLPPSANIPTELQLAVYVGRDRA